MKYRINLYTESFRPPSRTLGPRTLTLSFVGALLLVLLSGLWLQQTNHGLEQQVQAMKTENDQLQQRMLDMAAQLERQAVNPEILNALRETMNAIEGKRRLYAHLDGSQSLENMRFSAVMRALSNSQVQGLWLTQVRAAGEHLLLSGNSLSEELVPQWIEQLSLQKNFDGRKFSFLEINRPQDDKTRHLSFSLSTSLEREVDDRG